MHNKKAYPALGDLIYLDAEPHNGREIGGHDPIKHNIRRLCVVLSNTEYNQLTHFVIVMAITHGTSQLSSDLYLPFADKDSGIEGNIITWQLPSYDYDARNGEIVGKISGTMINKLTKQAKEMIG